MLLACPGVNITGVEFTADRVIVDVALRRRRLVCPHCGYSTRWRHNTQTRLFTWRGLDVGTGRSRSVRRCGG
jgi:transposase